MQTACVVKIPTCDFACGEMACYDAATFAGPWAFMCQSCFEEYGTGELGLGKGQRLVIVEEK